MRKPPLLLSVLKFNLSCIIKSGHRSEALQAGFFITIALGLFLLPAMPAKGQDDAILITRPGQTDQKKHLHLFSSDDILEVTISLDLSAFLRKKDKGQSFKGRMIFHQGETDSLDRKITVNYRGISRYENCRFPPMNIVFKKPIYDDCDTCGIRKMKLVNQCQQGEIFENYIIREYLVYKLYNVITDTSFRVRLVKINFIDSENKKKPMIRHGILVEPEDLLAKRTIMAEVNSRGISQRNMYPAIIDRIAIFNYMISNWDWSVPGQHNISVFRPAGYDTSGLGIPVPFDFDLCGVVNADYAVPAPEVGVESPRDRKFAGMCFSSDRYLNDLMFFQKKKKDFYSLINSTPYLTKAGKKDITGFLDQFFSYLETQKSIEKLVDMFLDNCKKL